MNCLRCTNKRIIKTKTAITPPRKRVRAQMLVRANGSVSFRVRGYDFRFADMPIDVNGYLFQPMRSTAKPSRKI